MNKKEKLLKNKEKEESPMLREIDEFEDENCDLIQDIPSEKIKKEKKNKKDKKSK